MNKIIFVAYALLASSYVLAMDFHGVEVFTGVQQSRGHQVISEMIASQDTVNLALQLPYAQLTSAELSHLCNQADDLRDRARWLNRLGLGALALQIVGGLGLSLWGGIKGDPVLGWSGLGLTVSGMATGKLAILDLSCQSTHVVNSDTIAQILKKYSMQQQSLAEIPSGEHNV